MIRWTKAAALIIMAAAQTAAARDDWYDPGMSIQGDMPVGAVAPGSGSVIVHVRIKSGEWSLSWQSPAGECRATLILPQNDRRDDVYVSSAVIRVDAGGSSQDYRIDSDVSSDGFNSMKIYYDGVTATLLAGDALACEVSAVPFGPGMVSVSVPPGGECRRIQLTQEGEPEAAAYSEPEILEGGLERMLLRVAVSDDRNEGVWEYFGKDADAAKVTVGGRYILATAANNLGGYDLVYVAGADANTGMWRSMALKGRLSPTIFADDFDLEWNDADGKRVEGDTHARISGDGSQLTLGFPDHGATLKFRRVRAADVIRKAGL